MAHSLSALKRHRQSLRRHERNRARRSAARTAVRKARAAIAAGKGEEARQAVDDAAAVLDRAARKGSIHANNAARYKSRLMRGLQSAAGGGKRPTGAAKRSPARKSARAKKKS